MSEDDGQTCAATPGCQRYPAPGLLTCRGHLERLGAMLRDIEDEAAILSAVPSMQQRTGPSGSLASQRVPVRLDVLVHNDPRHGTGKSEDETDELAAGETLSVLATLHSWARLLREERGFATRRDPVTISSERDTLSRHLEFAAAQPWIDEMYRDLTALLGQLRTANHHRPERPYSRCPVVVDAEHCAGSVWIQDELQAVWRLYADRCAKSWEQAPGSAVCDTCGATWVTDGDKARLKRMVDDMANELARPRTISGEPMLTAQELANHLGKSVNAVRIIASRQGIGSVDGYYDPDMFVKASA